MKVTFIQFSISLKPISWLFTTSTTICIRNDFSPTISAVDDANVDFYIFNQIVTYFFQGDGNVRDASTRI